MSEARNCRRCGNVFQYAGGIPLCPECAKKDEEDFNAVREYLYNNPRASMLQIAETLEIPVEKIMRYLREGRLETTSETELKLECQQCGKPIMTGRFCTQCSESLQSSFKTTADTMKTESENSSGKQNNDDIQSKYYNKKIQIIARNNNNEKKS